MQYLSTLREIINHPLNKGNALGAVAKYLRWNVGRRLLDTSYALPLANELVVIVSNRENYATLCYTCRLYDFAEMAFLLHFLRDGDVFGDFGANVGVYSVLASTAFVVSVEPIPNTFLALSHNLRLNRVKGTALNCGLGAAPGAIDFTTTLGGLNRVAMSQDSNTIRVPIKTIDEATRDFPPSVMKLDVEGYELPSLQGATKTITNPALRAVIIELNGSGRRFGYSDDMVDELLHNAGFFPHAYAPMERRLVPLQTYNRDCLNTLYLRKAAIKEISARLETAPRFNVLRQSV